MGGILKPWKHPGLANFRTVQTLGWLDMYMV
uniref:Uncharacterized protein n=1 Tax=Vitis vinifera TaxID=29760 RepID=F6I173_VITVI